MSNNDNINVTRDILSDMDKIFIPEDLDDNVSLEDLATYKSAGVKCFRTVPENYCLVTKNIFTQNVNAVSGIGLKFFAPLFTKTILVPLMDATKSYRNLAVTSIEGTELKIDLDLVMHITNPAKYITSGKYQLSQLNSLLGRLLTVYVAGKSYDEMVKRRTSLNNFDPNNEFGEFERLYGIKIEKVIIEKVELPENIKQQYNDKAEEREKKIAQSIRLEAMKEKAIAEAEIRGIEAQAKAGEIRAVEEAKNQAYIDKLFGVLDKMKAQGLSTSFLEKYINTLTMAETGNTIFMNGSSNNIASDIAGGIVAGTKAINNEKKKPMTNIDKLIYGVTTRSNNGEQNYDSIYKKFTSNPKLVEKINKLNEEELEKVINGILGENEISRSNDIGSGRGRK